VRAWEYLLKKNAEWRKKCIDNVPRSWYNKAIVK